MATTPIINTFGYMTQDALPYTQPQGTYRYAKNMVKGDRYNTGYGLSTEESTAELDTIEGFAGHKYIESLDASIMFKNDGSLWLFDHAKRKLEFVCKDSEFGCNWGFQGCEFIDPVIKTDQPCNETKIYWSSGCDYYVVNLAEMLNPTRKAALIAAIGNDQTGTCGYTCDHFRLMKCVCSPTLTAIPTEKGGHRLESGSYQFLVQLEDNGGNTTNWFSATDPISLGSENNYPGELSQGSIKLHITNLDCRYDKVNIAVVKSVEGVMSARMVHTQHYNSQGITFIYVGQDRGRDIPLEEINTKKKQYIRGKKLAQKDSQLYLYQIRQEKNLNMQRRVLSEAQLSFIEIETTAEMVKKYGMPTLERGENYLFGIMYNYCDGTHSAVFLMDPSNSSCSGGGAGFSGSITTPTGTAQKVERPRGAAASSADGASFGCATGNCSGGGGTTSGGVESRATGGGDDQPTDGVLENIEQWTTNTSNVVEAAKCDDCTEPWCCDDADHPTGGVSCLDCGSDKCVGCVEDENAYAADLPLMENIFGKHTDELIDNNQDEPTNYDDYTWKEAAKALEESVRNSEFRKITKDEFTVITSVGGGSSAGEKTEASNSKPPLVGEPTQQGFAEGKTTKPNNQTTQSTSKAEWSDQYTDGAGNYLLDETPKVVGCWAPEVVTTTELYPDSMDCDGVPLYGGQANTNLKLFRTPTADKSPFVVATSAGVPSQNSTVDPLGAVKIRLLGAIASAPEPNPEDLPKPLCGNNPWSLVMVQRTEINSTVQAKGIMFGTFEGQTNGQTVTYLRHGANSRCNMDRWIDNGGMRFGSTSLGPGVAFYGLDTAIGKTALSGGILRTEIKFDGIGYRYGLYEKGEEPREGLTGRRKDQRGARQYINLNVPSARFQESPISAVGYLNADDRMEVSGAANEVSTKHRESCVYIEAGGATRLETDSSFTADTLNHNCPIPDAYGVYGAVVRSIPDQYGAVTGLSFIKTGLEGGGFSTYQGVIGDTYIGPYSFVRRGFVSDKVGNTHETSLCSTDTDARDRTVCDSPNDLILQKLGLDFHSTQLPLTGDCSDAKNWAGGHRNDPWDTAYPQEPRDDYYYPKVQKTLITTWIESRINPWYRATGLADGEEGQVYYPKLKGLALDSGYSSTRHPWHKSYINRWSYVISQPSVAQLLRKYFIKTLVYLIMPMIFTTNVLGDITGVVDGVMTAATSVVLIAYWNSIKKLFTRDDYLDKMLGLPVCKTDAAGGEDDNYLEGWEDNFHLYNMDHSMMNTLEMYQSMPTVYNTCSCDSCKDFTTNEIFYSRKQIQGSPIDFYKQFQAFSFLNIPADSGKLMKLFNLNGDFFAHTTDFIIPIKTRAINIQTNIGTSLLGGDKLFDNPIEIGEGITEGFAGNIDPNATAVTPMGYIFIDRPAKKIYAFSGQTPRVISMGGMEKFFNEYLDFCEVGACHDQHVKSGTGYSIGYDPRFKRILFTKRELDKKKSVTISLDLNGESPQWISLHDYTPQYYFNDRSELFAIEDDVIHIHNAGDGTYRNFYGQDYASEVEFVAVADGSSFIYQNTEINTEAEEGNRKGLDKTFTSIAAYNTTQGTGTKPTQVWGDNKDTRLNPLREYSETDKLNLHKVGRIFRTNAIKDTTKAGCKEEAMTIKEDCIPIAAINEAIFDCLPKQARDYTGKVVADDHLIYRMTFDQNKNTLLRLLTVKTNVDKEQY